MSVNTRKSNSRRSRSRNRASSSTSSSSSSSSSSSLSSATVVYNNEFDENEEWASDDDNNNNNNSYILEVYSRDELLATTSRAERLYLKSRPGICAGMTLAWLQQIVQDDMQPRSSWPDVSYSRSLQEHIENHYIRHHMFPEIGGMTDEGTYRFSTVDDGLSFVWNRSGSYMLLIRPRYSRVGHAVAYSDHDSWPNGYLMNPNKGNHCCYSYQALSNSFRSDRFIRLSETSPYGPEFIVIKIGKKYSVEHTSDEEDEVEEDEDENDEVSEGGSTDNETDDELEVEDENEEDYDDSASETSSISSSESDESDDDYYAEYEASSDVHADYVHYAANQSLSSLSFWVNQFLY